MRISYAALIRLLVKRALANKAEPQIFSIRIAVKSCSIIESAFFKMIWYNIIFYFSHGSTIALFKFSVCLAVTWLSWTKLKYLFKMLHMKVVYGHMSKTCWGPGYHSPVSPLMDGLQLHCFLQLCSLCELSSGTQPSCPCAGSGCRWCKGILQL